MYAIRSYYEITKQVVERFPKLRVGIHCHNDIGCAVASSMLAVDAGACHVQGTFLGIGERIGNADLSVLIPNFQLKKNMPCISGNIADLTETAILLSETSNIALPTNKPYTGASAFAHKGGMHIDVITSYSIHYTKLYEWRRCFGCRKRDHGVCRNDRCTDWFDNA